MFFIALFYFLLSFSAAQPAPNTFPQDYPGKPTGDFGTNWQSYYQVKAALPGVNFPLTRSFAGNIPTNRPDHPNCTLFFWAFEKSNGSLTSSSSTEPWAIWLNGGPGSSSLYGLLFENGPIHIAPDFSVVSNNFSWNKLADTVWVDQPCGTGFSTSDSTGYVPNEDVMAQDFLGFLSNLVKIFPSLATRPLYLTGESYAGTYIPYITKALFGATQPPVSLAKIAIGDGAMTSLTVTEEISTVQIIETHPQLIGFDTEVYSYFKSQQELCGYDIQLTYPQNGTIPTIDMQLPTGSNDLGFLQRTADRVSGRNTMYKNALTRLAKTPIEQFNLRKREPLTELHAFKRSLAGRTNGSIDARYGCFTLEMLEDYAVNFTFPWALGQLDVYDVPDALNPEAPADATRFLNGPVTRAALHAPTSKDWAESVDYPFQSEAGQGNEFGDPSDPPMNFFNDLFANASKHNVGIVIYSGNDDMLVARYGSELTIQNTTWGGAQGFTQQPSTPWFSDTGAFAGIVHQERNVTFVLFKGAGHQVPMYQPENAFVFMREFILGHNATGLLGSNGKIVQGGVNTTLQQGIMPEYAEPIFFGAGTTASSTVWPSATITAWESFIATAATALSSTTAGSSGGNGASKPSVALPSAKAPRTLSFFILICGMLYSIYAL